MSVRILVIILVPISLLVSCTSTMLSNEKIISNTAGVLGVSEDNLTLVNRRSDTTTTYYGVRMQNGTNYICTMTGGGILAVGLTNPPTCNKK
jgi:hypothetical protein